MRTSPSALALTAGCLMAFVAARAHAQASEDSAGSSAAGTDSGAPVADAESGSGRHESRQAQDPMDWLGLTFQLGYAHQNAGSIANPVYNTQIAQAAAMLPAGTLAASGLTGDGGCTPIDRKCRVPSREGMLLQATLHLGGDGFGWDIAPYVITGGAATAVGLYNGPKFDIHIADPLYFGFGFGARLAYVAADGWQHGADIQGRIPVRFTLYFLHNLALVVEGSFGAGVSGYVDEQHTITDPRNGKPLGTAPKISFGAARTWDLSAGLRFP